MTNQIVYLTQYNKDYQSLQEEVLEDYKKKCIICNTKENITITNILPEEIYTELAYETWNNIPLCKYCNQKLTDKNRTQPNGIKNLIELIKLEDKKHVKWLR